MGYELVKILYAKNATVHLAARSEDKAHKAISSITEAVKDSKGSVKFLKLDLSDLTTIKASAEAFLANEKRLDWLCNNAGVMVPPAGSKSPQGHELQLATNCLGPWLFTQYLTPLLIATAAHAPPNSVRVSWAGSIGIDARSPTGGITMNDSGAPNFEGQAQDTIYGATKAGNLFYAVEYGKRCKKDGIVSTCFNPGNLKTELQRHLPAFQASILGLILYPAKFGAYTELWTGFSPKLTTKDNGAYIAPWGRVSSVRADKTESLKTKEEGGNGKAALFWDWTEKEVQKYL